MRQEDILAAVFLSLLLPLALRNPIRLPSDRDEGLPVDGEDDAVDSYLADKAQTSVHDTYLGLTIEKLSSYVSSHPANNDTLLKNDILLALKKHGANQCDATLLHFWSNYHRAPEGSSQKFNAHKKLIEVMAYIVYIDNNIKLIGKLLFGSNRGSEVLKAIRPAGLPVVDDWSCYESMIKTFEAHCGSIFMSGACGGEHSRSLANFCNAGVSSDMMAEVAAQVCIENPFQRSSLHLGLSE